MNGEERLLERIRRETPVEIQRTVVGGKTIQALAAGSGEPMLLLHFSIGWSHGPRLSD